MRTVSLLSVDKNVIRPILLLYFLFNPAWILSQVAIDRSNPVATVKERFKPPEGYYRVPVKEGSFAEYLRGLPLRPKGDAVKDYRGRVHVSPKDSALAAVIAMEINGEKMLQCMDILIFLYSDYLSAHNNYASIRFPLPDGLMFSLQQWQSGLRPSFSGLHFRLKKEATPSADTSDAINRFLRTIYYYSNTQTFYHYYKNVELKNLRIGDFIVKKGKNGHAVMIVDLIENNNGHRRALFAQGDTPACALHILSYRDKQPWAPIEHSQKAPPLPISQKMVWEGLRRFALPVKQD